MMLGTKLGIGIGATAAALGAASSKVVYDDASHDRHNDRNSLVNMGLWFSCLGAAGAGAIAHFTHNPVAPWLLSAAGLGVAAGVGAKAAEAGWTSAGVAYCGFGICNIEAREQHGASMVYVGRNPLDRAAR
jgi:hypothetical protein